MEPQNFHKEDEEKIAQARTLFVSFTGTLGLVASSMERR